MAVFHELGSPFCVCPYNKSPTIWVLYWEPGFLETSKWHVEKCTLVQYMACSR